MIKAARGNDSQQAEPGEEQSASSLRGKNTTSNGHRACLSETEVGSSLPSSRTMRASILDNPRNQTASSAAQSIPPTGGNTLWQEALGKECEEGRLAYSFLHELPRGRKALPWLWFPKGCWPWCVQTSQTDVIVPSLFSSSHKHLFVKPLCLSDCLGPEAQTQPPRLLCRVLRQGP